MNILEVAKKVFKIEASGLNYISSHLDANFEQAVTSILTSKGRAIVCGMGKSGIIGKKIAASFASTGTPSFFMHPGEAFHGDLGMVTADDVFIAISNSGETDEVLKLLPYLRDNRNVIIAMTGNPHSTLAQNAHFHLNVGVPEEACPLQLAPTASTTATLAMGDALTVALMESRGFKPENFARFHPGGFLGRKLLMCVESEMVSDNLPLLSPDDSAVEVIHRITEGGLGLAIVMTKSGQHIITDGDLRRAIEKYQEAIFHQTAADLMSGKPIGVSIGTRIEDAYQLMEKHSISSLLVTDPCKEDMVVGIFKK